MMRSLPLCAVVPLLVVTLACGGGEDGGNNLTGPTNTFPSVAGNYAGTTTITFPEVNQTLSCPTTTSVAQTAGTGSVSIAPLQLGGGCAAAGLTSLPVGSVTIDRTGAFPNENGTTSGGSCGTYDYVASGGFFGRDFRISMVHSSPTCLDFNTTINLTRS